MKNLGRNDTCHCGSGKKFKKCCLNNPKAIVWNVITCDTNLFYNAGWQEAGNAGGIACYKKELAELRDRLGKM